jgi:membrane protein DedA with SNARE-associated domain
MFEEVDELSRALGAWGYLGLGVASLVEYLFPPFPGDTVTVLGGAWAARGERSLSLVYLALMLGSAVGVSATWRVGVAIGGKMGALPDERVVLGLEVGQLRRAQALMKTRGAWLLLLNRFLPSFRAVIFVAAGASGVPFVKTLFLGLVSAALFNGVLLSVGAVVGDNAERIAEFFRAWRWVSLGVLAVVVVAAAGRWWWRRRGAPPAP